MRQSSRILAVGCLLIVAGCGDSIRIKTVPAPHGGVMVAIPDDQGWVELQFESKSGDGRDRNAESELIAYFLNPAGNAALEPVPSDVKVTFQTPKVRSIPMTLTPSAGDANGSARYVSPSGKYGSDELNGSIEATIAGKPVSLPFQLR